MTSNKTDDSKDNVSQRADSLTSMPSKADKRAEALRANLKRRKAFTQAQKQDEEHEEPETSQ